MSQLSLGVSFIRVIMMVDVDSARWKVRAHQARSLKKRTCFSATSHQATKTDVLKSAQCTSCLAGVSQGAHPGLGHGHRNGKHQPRARRKAKTE